MNITISKTSTLRIIAILMALALLVWGGSWALSNGFPARWFAAPMPISHGFASQPAMQAVTAIYSADPASERSAWEDMVCTGMTAKGCSLFRVMYAPAIWTTTAQQHEVVVTFLHVADTLEDGSQIWKISVTQTATLADIYIHVEANPTSGQWMLDRVLFTQEAAKYAD